MTHASVIIPTFNRSKSILRTLASIATQSLNGHELEVIVVDDGSTMDMKEVKSVSLPHLFRYIRQQNAGSAEARNRGAQEADGEILVFIDDDITLKPEYVLGLLEEHHRHSSIVAMGTLVPVAPMPMTPFASALISRHMVEHSANGSQNAQFTDCTTNNLSVRRSDFLSIGMFHDLAGDGRSLWGDVEFGYRALAHGLDFRRSTKAVCFHHDYSLRDFETALQRSYETGITAAAMTVTAPEIMQNLPMFRDKKPIDLRSDPPRLVLRKMARRLSSTAAIAGLIRSAAGYLERTYPRPRLLHPLYRWGMGAELARGFRHGSVRISGPPGSRKPSERGA